jgi:hypothetical protein
MLRSFDLSIFQEQANDLLNDPELSLLSMKISCSEETGYTVATMHMKPCDKRDRRFQRFIERFILSTENQELDNRLADKEVRLLNQHIFPTAEGTIVVLDYQVRKGRQVGV